MFTRALNSGHATRFAVVATGVSVGSAAYMASARTDKKRTRVAVIGGGTAGLTVSSQLLRKDKDLEITIVDGSQFHFYQPAWTLVGRGLCKYEDTKKPMGDVVKDTGAKWVAEHAKEVRPEENKLITTSGKELEYDYLVLAAGMSTEWGAVTGLEENLGHNGVVSNYAGGQSTWKFIQQLDTTTPRTVLFTYPPTSIKCGGAPQKAMYLSEEYWRLKGLDMHKISIQFLTPGQKLFAVPKYNERLVEICAERHIEPKFGYTLTAVEVMDDGKKKHAVFEAGGTSVCIPFDILHVSPHMAAMPFLRESSLCNSEGWVDVDQSTLQSTKYENVFSLGDCSSVPTSKTAAAVCKQAPVLVKNLLAHRAGQPLSASYNGYTSCPLMTGKNSVLLCEFGYGGEVMESFPWDQSWDNGLRGRFHAFLKKVVFPKAYWGCMLKGRWYGPTGPFEPK